MIKLTTAYLEACDLTAIHAAATFFGAIMCIYVSQITNHLQANRHDPLVLQMAHRAALTALALTFLWQFMYSYDTGWTPWPPALAMNLTVDALLIIRAFTVNFMAKRDGFRPSPYSPLTQSKRRRAIH